MGLQSVEQNDVLLEIGLLESVECIRKFNMLRVKKKQDEMVLPLLAISLDQKKVTKPLLHVNSSLGLSCSAIS